MTNFDQISYLSHKNNSEIHRPLLLFSYYSQKMRHIVVSLFKLIKGAVDSVFDADRVQLNCRLK